MITSADFEREIGMSLPTNNLYQDIKTLLHNHEQKGNVKAESLKKLSKQGKK